MTEKQIQASINQHLRKIRALELQIEVNGRLASHKDADLYDIQSKIKWLADKLESERDFLYLLESGDIESYQEVYQ
jgi:hypothetical protein